MIGPSEAVAAVRAAGFTHLAWVPDGTLGAWQGPLSAEASPRVLRVAREGEAIGLACGLMLGGARPLVVVQSTGFFEAGDALRNAVHDLGLPLKLLVGVRGAKLGGRDNCARFAGPVARAWRVPVVEVDPAAHRTEALAEMFLTDGPWIVLWAE